MNRRLRPTAGPLAAVALALAACQSMPRDAYGGAEAALARGDLPGALRGFDSVALTDLRYPEARLAAAALERRLRRHQELLLQGLRLRGEWRDDEAIASFRGALDAWPSSREAEQLLSATMQRRLLLSTLPGRSLPVVAGAGLPRVPGDGIGAGIAVVAATPPEPAAAPAPSASESVAAPEAAPPVPAAKAPTASVRDPIGDELAQIEGRLSAGAFEQVLADLQVLHRVAPGDVRVASRLARMLQQRGLMRYGQGDVGPAVMDLQRAVELDPGLQSARVLFELASREIASPPR